MKISLLALVLIGMVGCSSDDDSNSNNPAPVGQLIATIDGTAFIASGVNAVASFTNGTLNITGLNIADNEIITITVLEGGVGTFDLSATANLDNGAAYTIGGGNAYLSPADGGSGQLVVTKLDVENGLASGTFEFVGTRQVDDNGNIVDESVTVTNGAFNDIILATEIGGNSNNVLTAKVDGSAPDFDSVNVYETTLAGQTTINISAVSNATSQNVGLSFPSDTETGTFELASFFGDYKGLYNPQLGGSTNIYTSSPGTITISSITSNSVEGTFEFSAKRLDPNDPDIIYEITEGVFSIEY